MTVNHRCSAGWDDQYPCHCEPAIENPFHPDYHRLNEEAGNVLVTVPNGHRYYVKAGA